MKNILYALLILFGVILLSSQSCEPINEHVIIHDTIQGEDIILHDTIQGEDIILHDTLILQDTFKVHPYIIQDTIVLYDTIIGDTIIMNDTCWLTDTVIITDTVIMTDTIVKEPLEKYSYVYDTFNTFSVLPYIMNVTMDVVAENDEGIYVIDIGFKLPEALGVNAISMVIQYDPTNLIMQHNTVIDGITYVMTFDKIDPNGTTMWNNTGHDLRYAFMSLNKLTYTENRLMRIIVKVNNPTVLNFSPILGDVMFSNFDAKPYILYLKSIKFN